MCVITAACWGHLHLKQFKAHLMQYGGAMYFQTFWGKGGRLHFFYMAEPETTPPLWAITDTKSLPFSMWILHKVWQTQRPRLLYFVWQTQGTRLLHFPWQAQRAHLFYWDWQEACLHCVYHRDVMSIKSLKSSIIENLWNAWHHLFWQGFPPLCAGNPREWAGKGRKITRLVFITERQALTQEAVRWLVLHNFDSSCSDRNDCRLNVTLCKKRLKKREKSRWAEFKTWYNRVQTSTNKNGIPFLI